MSRSRTWAKVWYATRRPAACMHCARWCANAVSPLNVHGSPMFTNAHAPTVRHRDRSAHLADWREAGVLDLLRNAVDDAAKPRGEQRCNGHLHRVLPHGVHCVLEVHGGQQTCISSSLCGFDKFAEDAVHRAQTIPAGVGIAARRQPATLEEIISISASARRQYSDRSDSASFARYGNTSRRLLLFGVGGSAAGAGTMPCSSSAEVSGF